MRATLYRAAIAFLVVLIVLLVMAAPAAAGPPVDLGPGQHPSIEVTPEGGAVVVWNRSGAAPQLLVCYLPPRAKSCPVEQILQKDVANAYPELHIGSGPAGHPWDVAWSTGDAVFGSTGGPLFQGPVELLTRRLFGPAFRFSDDGTAVLAVAEAGSSARVPPGTDEDIATQNYPVAFALEMGKQHEIDQDTFFPSLKPPWAPMRIPRPFGDALGPVFPCAIDAGLRHRFAVCSSSFGEKSADSTSGGYVQAIGDKDEVGTWSKRASAVHAGLLLASVRPGPSSGVAAYAAAPGWRILRRPGRAARLVELADPSKENAFATFPLDVRAGSGPGTGTHTVDAESSEKNGALVTHVAFIDDDLCATRNRRAGVGDVCVVYRRVAGKGKRRAASAPLIAYEPNSGDRLTGDLRVSGNAAGDVWIARRTDDRIVVQHICSARDACSPAVATKGGARVELVAPDSTSARQLKAGVRVSGGKAQFTRYAMRFLSPQAGFGTATAKRAVARSRSATLKVPRHPEAMSCTSRKPERRVVPLEVTATTKFKQGPTLKVTKRVGYCFQGV